MSWGNLTDENWGKAGGVVLDIEFAGEPWESQPLCVGYGDLEELLSGGVDAVQFLEASPVAFTADTICHTKTDWRWLELAGTATFSNAPGKLKDTQTMAWVLDENQSLALDDLVLKYTGVTMDKRITQAGGLVYFRCDDGSKVLLVNAPIDQVKAYCARDVVATAHLYTELHQRLDASGWLRYWETEEQPFTEVLLGMEVAGLPLSLEDSEKLKADLVPQIERLEKHLLEEAKLPASSFNLNSDTQMVAYLFNKVFSLADRVPITKEQRDILKSEHPSNCEPPMPTGFTVGKVGRAYAHGEWMLAGRDLKAHEKTGSGKWSTSTPTLLTHYAGDPWIQQLVEMRKMETVVSTFLNSYPEHTHEGRLYGRSNQTGTKTGRLSSNGPNIQNQPSRGPLGKRLRGLFQAEPGHPLIIGDYSQLEPRLMAHFSGDPLLTDIYLNNKDLYITTAEGIFGRTITKEDEERDVCKTVILGLGYGAGAAKLATTLCLNGFPTTTSTAKGYLRELQSMYHVFFEWKQVVIAEAKRKGYVTTLGGRHRRLRHQFGESWNHKQLGYGERQAVNAVIQGSAADIVRRVMCGWGGYLDKEARNALTLLAQVHDELIWEQSGELEPEYVLGQLREAGEQGHMFDLAVPMVFEPGYCRSWADKGLGTGLIMPEVAA